MTAGGGNIKPTVVVSEDGSIAAGGERVFEFVDQRCHGQLLSPEF